jgi:hypothetical protein
MPLHPQALVDPGAIVGARTRGSPAREVPLARGICSVFHRAGLYFTGLDQGYA